MSKIRARKTEINYIGVNCSLYWWMACWN